MCGNKAKTRDNLSVFIFDVLYEHCNTFAPCGTLWADSKKRYSFRYCPRASPDSIFVHVWLKYTAGPTSVFIYHLSFTSYQANLQVWTMQLRLISVLGGGGGICSRLGIQAGRNCASSGQPDRAARWNSGWSRSWRNQISTQKGSFWGDIWMHGSGMNPEIEHNYDNKEAKLQCNSMTYLGNILLSFSQQSSMAEPNHLTRLSDTLYEDGDFTYFRFHFSFLYFLVSFL